MIIELKYNNIVKRAIVIFFLICVLFFFLSFLTSCSITAGSSTNNSFDPQTLQSLLQNAVEPLKNQLNELLTKNAILEEKNNELVKKLEENNKKMDKSVETNMLNGNNINDIKKMESEIRSLQESFKTSINTFSQNVQNVPNAVMEIKKITSLFDNSKKRGDIGEIHLEMIISSILPKEMYEMQSSENNFRYDCKITTSYKEYIIDAKFPLDNYWKIIETEEKERKEKYKKLFKDDLKNMINDLKKYERDVFLFISSERMYSDILEWFGEDFWVEAMKTKIIFCSPTTLWLLLQNISNNDKNMKLFNSYEEKAKLWEEFVAGKFKIWWEKWNTFCNKWDTLTRSIIDVQNTNIKLYNGAEKILALEKEDKKQLNEIKKNSISLKNKLTLINSKEKGEEEDNIAE